MNKSPPWIKPIIKYAFNGTKGTLAFLQAITQGEDIVRLPTINTNYLINHPDAIYHILLTNQKNYTKEGTSYDRVKKIVGKGLLTTSGEEWEIRRHEYQLRFQDKHLRQHLPTIQHYTQRALNIWEKQLGKFINITEEMLALTMNISSEVLFGLNLSERSLEFVKWIHTIHKHAILQVLPWNWLPTIGNLRCKIYMKAVDNYLLEKFKTISTTNSKPLLDNLFTKDEHGNWLNSADKILEEAKNFFIAGHETTGNAISWALYFLAKNPYSMSLLVEEIDNELGNENLDFESIQKLKYLDLVIQETLRMAPPIWILTRKAIHEDHVLGYRIPAGTLITISPYLIHRHNQYWNQPSVFYPERFIQDPSKRRPKCAYIPFGFGPRACIGHQFSITMMKIIIAAFLQKFRIKSLKPQIIQPLPLITLKPNKGVWLQLNNKFALLK